MGVWEGRGGGERVGLSRNKEGFSLPIMWSLKILWKLFRMYHDWRLVFWSPRGQNFPHCSPEVLASPSTYFMAHSSLTKGMSSKAMFSRPKWWWGLCLHRQTKISILQLLSHSHTTTQVSISLVPRPHPLMKRNGLVNQVKFLGPVYAFPTM